jgi:Transposase DDE domain
VAGGPQHHPAHPGLGQVGAHRWHIQPGGLVFDRTRNIYICPNGKLLHTTGTIYDGKTIRYRASKLDCDARAFKMQCCPHTPARQIPRDLHEDARDVARALANTEAFEQSRRERKKVEMCFAHMKRIFQLDRLRPRGLSGAKDEVLLTAIAQNLRRLVEFLCRPPPSAPVTCAA